LKPAALSKNDEKKNNQSNNSDNNKSSNNHHPPNKNNNNNNNNNNHHAKVKFNETVDVVSIPSRHQFSNRIKNVYWSNRYELQENAQRNILEYEYEGWDYHNVVLDEDMYIDSSTGALIHPCHLSVDEATGQTVINSYDAVDEQENSSQPQQGHQKLLNQVQEEQEDDDDDGFEYADDDSYFRPLQRQSSVASSQ
jgi:hypothetical protein